MTRYDDQQFDPPAPVALVTLRSTSTDEEVGGVMMLIDSGSDVSLIPLHLAERLLLPTARDKRYQLVGFDGSQSAAKAVSAVLILDKRVFRGFFLVIDQDYWILNAGRWFPDGPQGRWDFHTAGT